MAQVKIPMYPRVHTGRNIVADCVPRELTGPYFIARAKVAVDFSCTHRYDTEKLKRITFKNRNKR